MRQIVIGLVLVALFAVTARAEEPWDGWQSDFVDPADEALWLRGVTSVKLITDDHVTDGCWTNESAVRTAIELSLRRAGIEIIAEADYLDLTSLPSHVLALRVNGHGTGLGGCLGTYELQFDQVVPASLIVPGASSIVVFSPMNSGGYLSGYDTMNEPVRTFAIEQTDALALRILRARDAE